MDLTLSQTPMKEKAHQTSQCATPNSPSPPSIVQTKASPSHQEAQLDLDAHSATSARLTLVRAGTDRALK